MTSVFRRIETFSKEEVLHLIAENHKMLDEDLTLIGRDLGTRGEKLWDLVGIDSKKRLSLIDVELRYTDKVLYQIVQRLDWVWEHMGNITKMYSPCEIDSDQMPRVLIVAPSYSPFFKKSITYLTYRVKVDLFTYMYLKSSEGNGIFLEPLETRVKHEQVLKSDGNDIKSLEVSHSIKVTTEEIMEFLH